MAFDSKSALNHAIKYLTDAAYKRAAGGWIPPKEEEKRKKEAAKSEEKQQKLLSKQFPTQYMPEVGRQVMADGGTPEDQYDLGKQLQRGAQILGGTAKAQYERYGEPIVTGIQELMRPVYEGGTQESYLNPEMVGRSIDVVGGLGAGSLLTGPAAAETNVLRSGMGSTADDLFDFSRLSEVPKVKQFDLPRYQPARGVPARVTDVAANKDVQNKMLEMMTAGQKIGGPNWYNADPLRDKFIEKLGADAGDTAFRKYMDLVAATSPRSKVGENVRNASYYYQRLAAGEGAPEVGAKNPSPYGHMAQRLHQMNVQRVAGEGWDPLNNPKPASFVENLVGNQAPVTVDTHAFRAPAIFAADPRFLETAYKSGKDTPPMNIQKMVESGEMSMEDALKTPAYWQAQPKENEYGAMENYYKSLAQELGLTPAQGQASGWVGGAAMTGLASDESKPFLRFFQDRVMKTAEELNMDPNDVLDKFIRGDIPLKSHGGEVEGYADGGSIGIGGMAAFGDPSKGPDEYGVTTPMEALGDLLMNMSPEQREYLSSEMTKQMNANPASTANSPLAAGIESYDADAAQAPEDVRRAEQQASRDAAIQRTIGPVAQTAPQATDMFAPPAMTTAFGAGIRDVGFPTAATQPFAKAPVSETSDTRAAPKTIRQNFNQAFADAKAAGLKNFTWVNPATGKAMVYTTQLARKEGGRVPSLANPDDWIEADEKPKAKKSVASKKPAKSDGTAIVNRALMLSSRKS